jgi:hypothetical protein
VDGDGYADIVAGTPLGAGEAGRALLWLGGLAPDDVFDVDHAGDAAGDHLGYVVAGAGDLDGDGYADVALGAPGSDPAAGPDAGLVTVCRGGAPPTGLCDVNLPGSAAGDQFGFSIASR